MIVTLRYDPKRPAKLRAVADDGIHGEANCSFPTYVCGVDRLDSRYAGTMFKVSNIKWDDARHCYHVNRNDVLGITHEVPETIEKSTTSPISSTSSILSPINDTTKATPTAKSDPATMTPAERRRAEAKARHKLEGLIYKRNLKRNYVMDEKLNTTTHTPLNLTESLFEPINEAEYSLSMKDSPLYGKTSKKAFTPKVETWILIKLYEACIAPGVTYTDIVPFEESAIGAEAIDAESGEIIGTKGVKRGELIARVGTALDAPSQTSTYFNYYKVLHLAYLRNGIVIPGPKLKGWIEGTEKVEVDELASDKLKAELAAYPNPPRFGFPLTKWLDTDVAKRTPTAPHKAKDASTAYGDMPDFDLKGDLEADVLSADDLKKYGVSGKAATTPTDTITCTPSTSGSDRRAAAKAKKTIEPVATTDTTTVSAEEPIATRPDESTAADRRAAAKARRAAGKSTLTAESIDPANPAHNYAFIRNYNNKIDEQYRNRYREYKDLDETFEITEENFDEPAFLHLSNLEGWNYDRARDGILRR